MKKEQNKELAKNVDEYLDNLPPKVKETLENIRSEIKKAAPMAEEVISYRIPTYKYKGALVHFMAHEKYCSFFVVNKSILELFKDELKDFETSGTTIHFTVEKPLPLNIVERIVKERIRQNEMVNKNK